MNDFVSIFCILYYLFNIEGHGMFHVRKCVCVCEYMRAPPVSCYCICIRNHQCVVRNTSAIWDSETNSYNVCKVDKIVSFLSIIIIISNYMKIKIPFGSQNSLIQNRAILPLFLEKFMKFFASSMDVHHSYFHPNQFHRNRNF